MKSLGVVNTNSYIKESECLKEHASEKKKVRISIAIDPDLLKWIDQMIAKGLFANRSHAIHRALLNLKKKEAP